MIAFATLLLSPMVMKNRTSRDIPVSTVFRALSSGSISVKVSGDVLHPGIYEVPANSLASTVINMAVPLRPPERNMIAPVTGLLHNGSAVRLMILPDGSSLLTVDQMSVAESMVLGIPLDIATMSEADFERLPGVGPNLARRIVAYRQNNGGILNVDDLIAVEGVGEKKFKVISSYFQPP
jgi:competence protein ComEA